MPRIWSRVSLLDWPTTPVSPEEIAEPIFCCFNENFSLVDKRTFPGTFIDVKVKNIFSSLVNN